MLELDAEVYTSTSTLNLTITLVLTNRTAHQERDFYRCIFTQSRASFDTYVTKGTLLHNYGINPARIELYECMHRNPRIHAHACSI